MIFVVSKDADSWFAVGSTISWSIKPFRVAVILQVCLRANQRLPFVTTQWRGTILSISDQWVQRVSGLDDDGKLDWLANLHTETDFGEGSVPVRWQFGLLWIEPSLPSSKVVFNFVSPVSRIVPKGILENNGYDYLQIKVAHCALCAYVGWPWEKANVIRVLN